MSKMIEPDPKISFDYDKEIAGLRADWETHLKKFDVKWILPSQEVPMVLLYANLGRPVSQQQIVDFCKSRDFNYKNQLRHVADRGWSLGSGSARYARGLHLPYVRRDCYVLLSSKDPNQIWLTKKNRSRFNRDGYLSVKNWDEMLALFEDRGCAVCGRKMRHYDKGHLDPNLAYSIHNIVPMCVECNNHAGAHGVMFELSDDLVARAVAASKTTSHFD